MRLYFAFRLFVPGVGACVGVSGGVGGLISRFVATDICFALSLPFSRFQQDPCLPRVLQVRMLYECGKAQVIFTYPPFLYSTPGFIFTYPCDECARRGDRAVVSWQRPWVPPLRLAEQRADQVVRLAPMHWRTLPV